ncbi:TetR/AcrR family transcriptional regulator [Streptomyces sp. YIM 130001]|uniref:TetR/AcrR family transcriptional regulator n=1 Tax=Streptomyces sp. YIM 130001 TaxID=2259644 RepID=UPI000E64CC95|nr:TetR/AcrR family transcriptional regulator [Streptomyces sp. YIM 130001]
MARPPQYDSDRLLDAALELAAGAGPPAVTMAAVAKAAGAPSGSVYHRFPSRTALLAELWLRTVEDFQEGWLAALSGPSDPAASAAAGARHVVAWSRGHRPSAAVLLYGTEDYGRADWSEPHLRRAKQGHDQVHTALRALGKSLGLQGKLEWDQLTLAVVELPLAVVRGPLRTGAPIPVRSEDLAERSTRALLAGLAGQGP